MAANIARPSYNTFRAAFLIGWLLEVAAVVLAGATHSKARFGLFIPPGLIFAMLGLALALNVGGTSDRMAAEASQRSSLGGRPLSMTRLGGVGLLIIGLGGVVVGLAGLVS